MTKLATALEIALQKEGIKQTRHSLAHTAGEGIMLGRELEDGKPTGKPITLGGGEQFSGLHVMGLPRFGKSAFLINLFLHYARCGDGVAYLDPHFDAISDILARLPLKRENDVIILDPTRETHAFGLNLLTCDNPRSDLAITYSYNQLWSVFSKLYRNEQGEMGIWLEKFLSNALLALLEHSGKGYTICEITRMLTEKPFREYIARPLRNRVVADFWLFEFPALPRNYQWEEIQSTMTRLNRFLQHTIIRSIVGQTTTIDFREIMDTKKLLLMHTPRGFPDDLKKMLYTILITQLLRTMFSRADTPKEKRVPFFLICDEVENYAIDEFSAFFEEGGKYAVGVVAAHQSLYQWGMTEAVRNSLLTAGNKVYLRVNDRDTDVVAPGFAKPPEEKPIPTTIPRDVLPYLKHHIHPLIKHLWAQCIAPLEEALAKEGIRYEHEQWMDISGGRHSETIEILPEWNFGGGWIEYEPDTARFMRVCWNDLLYHTLCGDLEKQNMQRLFLNVVDGMASFLGFHRFLHPQGYLSIEEKLKSRGKYQLEQLTEYSQKVAQQEKAMVNDTDLLLCYLTNVHTAKEAWKKFHSTVQQEATECETRGNPRSYFENKRTEIVSRLQELEEREQNYICWMDPSRWELALFEDWGPFFPGTKRYRHLKEGLKETRQSIARLKQVLSSDEATLTHIAEQQTAYHKSVYGSNITITKEDVWKSYEKQARNVMESHGPYSTPEKFLARIKDRVEEKLRENKRQLASYEQELARLRTTIAQEDKLTLAGNKARYEAFTDFLNTTLQVLMQPENKITVVASTYNHQPVKELTEHEMIAKAARELRNLPKYQAFCKIVEERTTAVYHLALPPLPSPHKDDVVEDMTKRIWERMEANYYRPKAEVEADLINRRMLQAAELSAFVPLSATSRRRNGNGAKAGNKTN